MKEKTPNNNFKQKKAPEIKIKNMGVDIDKNEYKEIVLSNSGRPEDTYFNRDY